MTFKQLYKQQDKIIEKIFDNEKTIKRYFDAGFCPLVYPSRVLKDVRLLAEMNEIECRPDPRSNRKAKQLLPVHSINARLAGIVAP